MCLGCSSNATQATILHLERNIMFLIAFLNIIHNVLSIKLLFTWSRVKTNDQFLFLLMFLMILTKHFLRMKVAKTISFHIVDSYIKGNEIVSMNTQNLCNLIWMYWIFFWMHKHHMNKHIGKKLCAKIQNKIECWLGNYYSIIDASEKSN